jgi:threonine dehydratase
MTFSLPSLAELESAAAIVHRALMPTPQYAWPLLGQALGAEVWVKHENHTPIGAFKVRGGLVYFERLVAVGKPLAVISATRGNHGQSIGYAARKYGVAAKIVVPHGNSVEKNAAMRALGVELIEHGADFQEAREFAEGLAREHKLHPIPPFHRDLVSGVASYSLELLKAVPNLDVVYVPIGMGSGISGMIAARNALGLKTAIVGVVSSHAPAYFLSFAARKPIEHASTTLLADGLACRVPEPEALDIMLGNLDRIVEVSDDEIAEAMRLYYSATHNLVEGAGAAPLAAAWKERGRLAGKRVGLIASGGNVDRSVFAQVLAG